MRLVDLQARIEALPAGAMVPVAWVREQLAELEVESAAEPEAYTVRDLARRWHRAASTVRELLEGGAIPEAYRFRGREWRVPRAAVLDYEAGQQAANAPKPNPRTRRASLRDLARGTAA